MIAENRRALMRYEVLERLEAGIVLAGSEVKSLRAGKIELLDAYALVKNGEMFLVNAYIAPYAFATIIRHVEKRERKLLVGRADIDRLEGSISLRGATVVPLRVYWKGSRVKIELGVVRARDGADRRESIKKREGDREARAAMSRPRER